MDTPILNYWAILACGVASMAVGSIWYSPLLFAKAWTRLNGKTPERIQQEMKSRNMVVVYLAQFIAALVVAYVLAHFIVFLRAHTAWDGVVAGLWIGVGFVLATSLGNYLFENRPLKLFWINSGYTVVMLVFMGAILASWR